MKEIELNETPIRTSKNYNINNIKLNNITLPETITSFDNIKITASNNDLIKIENEIDNYSLTYGVGDIITNLVKEKANQKLKITLAPKREGQIQIDFQFDANNITLLDNIEIIAEAESKASVIIKYACDSEIECFHGGIIKLIAKDNTNINMNVVNLMNPASQNFISFDNEISTSAKVNYTLVDFGGKNCVTNYYSNLLGNTSENIVNAIYLGTKEQLFDFNYIGELRGEHSNIDIDVQGALNGTCKKHFKGTIDFKKGCKKARGNENETCILLSDKAKSLSLPILLCSEENVEGNHSSSAGKIDEKQLFYIMSRGFNLKEAMKLVIRAKFNKVLENISNEDLKTLIFNEIDKRI